ncbi:MAG TPA: TPM domain-containing protein, partial [Azonexus sp.]|nr:TPM domain-containing protein [Azonexus sp.]
EQTPAAHDAVEVILAKRDRGDLSDSQIDWVIDAYTHGRVDDAQMSALAMAILLNGMSRREIGRWTDAMIASGERMDFSSLSRPTADKHSTGGVGDKITLPLAPLVAACGVAVPQLSGRVVDQTGTLSSGDIAALSQKLRDFEMRKGSQVAVLIVPTTQPETIEQFSIRVAKAWKLGRKKVDDGAILVVAKNDRHLRIEVGYGLEGALNDATAKRIVAETMTPLFKAGDIPGGVSAGVDAILKVVAGEALPEPAVRDDALTRGGGQWNLTDLPEAVVFGLLFALVVGGTVLRHLFGNLLGSAVAGGVAGGLGWLVVGGVLGIVGGALLGIFLAVFGLDILLSGLFSGGSRGGSGGGSGGGFSGGGGSGGGGGASGSW